MPKETRSLHIPLDIHTKLKVEASKKGVKLRDLIIEILNDYLKKEVKWWLKNGQRKKFSF